MNRGLTSTYRALARSRLLSPAVLVEGFFDSGTLRLWSGAGNLVAGGQTYTGAGDLLSVSSSAETQNVRANGITVGLSGVSSTVVSLALNEECQGRSIKIKMLFFPSDSIPYIEMLVTVASSKFLIERVSQDTIYVNEGATYRFDQSDSTNSSHNLRISTTSNGTFGGGSQYSTGWTEVGTAGSAGAYNQWVVPSGLATSSPIMYYYCQSHSNMGGQIIVSNERSALNPFTVFDGIMDTMSIKDSGQTATTAISAESALISLQNPKVRRYTDEDQKTEFASDDGFQFVPDIQDLALIWGRS